MFFSHYDPAYEAWDLRPESQWGVAVCPLMPQPAEQSPSLYGAQKSLNDLVF